MTSRVFVVSEPRRWDPDHKAWVRTVNLKPAAQFGELMFLLPPNNEGSADPSVIVRSLHEKLADFGPEDYLLPVGSPIYIALAAAIAADNCDGSLNLLQWDRDERNYLAVKTQVWPDEAAA